MVRLIVSVSVILNDLKSFRIYRCMILIKQNNLMKMTDGINAEKFKIG